MLIFSPNNEVNMNILYSTHCPQCMMIEKQLKAKNIPFTVCDDTKTMIEKGFKKAPMFETDNKVMTFPETLKWVKEQ